MEQFPRFVTISCDGKSSRYSIPSGTCLDSELVNLGGVKIRSIDINEYLQYWELVDMPLLTNVDYSQIGGKLSDGQILEPDFIERAHLILQNLKDSKHELASCESISITKIASALDMQGDIYTVIMNDKVPVAPFFNMQHAVDTAESLMIIYGVNFPITLYS